MKNLITALLITASMATAAEKTTKATACLENRHFSDSSQFVRLVDAEGKKHRYSAFIIADGTDTEWGDFEASRKTVALDDGLVLTIKQGKDERGESILYRFGEIKHCPSKRASFPKL